MNPNHPVIQKLRLVQTQEKKWLWLYASSLLLAIFLISWISICLTDFYLRSDHLLVRSGLSLLLLAILLISVWKFLLPVARFRRNLVDIAKAIEAKNPRLNTELSLATDFLSSFHPDGSSKLREKLIETAEMELESIRWKNQIETSIPLRAAMGATFVFVLAVGLVIQNPEDSWLATRRTLKPFAKIAWPAFYSLEFENLPTRLAMGESFVCTVIEKNNRLPEKVFLEIDDGSGQLRRLMQTANNQAKFQVSNISRDLKVRAWGGDGETEWHEIKAISPPTVQDLVMDVSPPDYSQLPKYSIGPFEKVWSGSTVSLRGKTDLPVRRAELVLLPQEDQNESGRESESRQPIKLLSNTQFIFPASEPWVVESTQKFRIELTGMDGVKGGKRRLFRIPVRLDEPPMIAVSHFTDQRVYSRSDQVKLRFDASDDMRVQSITAVVRMHNRELGRFEIPFEVPPPVMANVVNRNDITSILTLDLNSLHLGTDETLSEDSGIVEVQGKVVDCSGQQTFSDKTLITIGTATEISMIDHQLKKSIFDSLRKVSSLQRSAAQLLNLVVQEIDQMAPEETARRTNQIADEQREVEASIFGNDGVVKRCRSYLESSSTTRSAENIEEITQIVGALEELQSPARLASDFTSEASIISFRSGPTRRVLEKASIHQKSIFVTLTKMIGEVDVQSRIQGAQMKITKILKQQKTILELCLRLQSEKLATRESLEIEIERLHVEQKGLTNQLNEVAWGLFSDAETLNSPFLEKFGESLKLAEIDSRLAADQIAKKQMGLAFQSMREVIEELTRMQQNNSPRKFTTALQRQAIELAGRQLDSILARTSGLEQEVSDWENLNGTERDNLVESLRKLRQELADFAESSANLLSPAALELLNDSDRLVSSMIEQLQQGNNDEAERMLKRLRSNLNKIENEFDVRASELIRQERQQRLEILQRAFESWIHQQTEIQSSLDQLGGSDPAIVEQLIVAQRKLTALIGRQKDNMLDFYAITLELERLESCSAKVESALKDGDLALAKKTVAEIIKRLEAVSGPEKKKTPSNSTPNSEQLEDKAKASPPVEQVQISDFEVKLLSRLQQEILEETRQLHEKSKQNLRARDQDLLTRDSLKLADRQSNLIQALKKYLGPTNEKSDEPPDNGRIPEIPRIEEIPDLPDFNCEEMDDSEKSPMAGLDDSTGNHAEQDAGDPPVKRKKTSSDNGSAIPPSTGFSDSSQDQAQGEDLGQGPNSNRNRLENIRFKMQQVEELLIRQRLSDDNQKLQQSIIDEFGLFLTDQQKQNQKDSKSKSRPQDGKQGNEAATNSQSPMDTKAKPNKEFAEQSEIQRRIDEIWGHLPDQIRKTQLSISSEQFLPKYRELIKAYFKRLANDPQNR